MPSLRLILNDQLSSNIITLQNFDKTKDVILMIESLDEINYVKHHKKKLVLMLSAMRHFAADLIKNGHKVIYRKIENSDNSQIFLQELKKIAEQEKVHEIQCCEPGYYKLYIDLKNWHNISTIPLDILPDNRFLCSIEEFKEWAKDRKKSLMGHFYLYMRKKHQILVEANGKPTGGKWNYDPENRKPPTKNINAPTTYKIDNDQITKEVIEVVNKYFPENFGDTENFFYAVTRKHALQAFEKFLQERLYYFGDYQDIMLEEDGWIYHSHISFYLNCGLLLPQECIDKTIEAYHREKAPLNCVEGFIRQIIGWREYIRGIYWQHMPQYIEYNYFDHHNKLPSFYWTADIKLNCMRQCLLQTKNYAFAHHAQRSMILGNFAMMIEIDPKEMNEWYLIVYADAYEWVEMPNVIGMVLYADGGLTTGRPYATAGAYMKRMTNYCKNCVYDVNEKNGPTACPFNYLYWHFLAKNREKLAQNPRIGMMYGTYDKMTAERKQLIRNDSEQFIATITQDSNQ